MSDKFDSGADKRVDNNPILPEDYSGPDDVSLRYRVLTEDEKTRMGRIKLLSQQLINEIRDIRPGLIQKTVHNDVVIECRSNHPYLEDAVKNIQQGAMWAIKVLTGPK